MARATKQASEATAELILAGASELFAARGYSGVGLEEVAEAAGVTRGAIYHHFRSKRGLFAAVAARQQQRVAEAVVQSADTETDPWEGLRAGCRAILTASLAEESRQILLIDAPAVLGWNSWRQQDAEASGVHLSTAIEELAGQGVLVIHSLAGATALLTGAMNEAVLYVAHSDRPNETTEEVIVDLFSMMDGMRRL